MMRIARSLGLVSVRDVSRRIALSRNLAFGFVPYVTFFSNSVLRAGLVISPAPGSSFGLCHVRFYGRNRRGVFIGRVLMTNKRCLFFVVLFLCIVLVFCNYITLLHISYIASV